MGLERGGIVMVEAEDHARPYLRAGVLYAAHLVHHAVAAAHVLQLTRFAQRFGISALDADENGLDAGVDHEPHKLLVVGKVERGLGHEADRKAVDLLPGNDVFEKSFDRVFVADEIVVDNEHGRHLVRAQVLELNDLFQRLEARLRPNITMMSQNSHRNGQSRENCTLPNA